MADEEHEARGLIESGYEDLDRDDDDLDYPPLHDRRTTTAPTSEQIGLVSLRPRSRANSNSIVSNVVGLDDDIRQTTLSFRVFLLGGILGCTGAAVGQIFFFKSNGIGFNTCLIILISYPMGKALERLLPDWTVKFSKKCRFKLNPGPFSLKEHLLIGVLASGASGSAYAGDIVAVQDLYYHQDIGHVGGLLLVLSTQLLGFGLAGLTYSFLVRPTNMVWPSSLVVFSIYNTLHAKPRGTTQRKLGQEVDMVSKKLNFFLIVFVAVTIYQFIPTVFASTLSNVAILCFINNQSQFMRVLGSAYTGVGLLNFSFDWAVLTGVGLQTPFYASCNHFSGVIWSMWVLVPCLWYFNFWNYQSFGDNAISAHMFNHKYEKYNVSAVVKPDLTLDLEKYTEMGPIQLPPYFAIYFGVGFAVLTSAISTVILFHSDDIRMAMASRSRTSTDVHVEMVEKNYAPVPASWYIIIGTTMGLAALYVVVSYPLQLPVWGLVVALVLATSFTIPLGIIKATTNTNIGLHSITELVAGILFPGKPLANVVFKVYGYMTMHQCLDLAADLKLGIYAKIPPKDMFISQILGTAIGGVVNYIFIRLVIADKREFLDGTVADPTGQWTGRKPELFYSGSVVAGLIGPVRFFSGKYKVLLLGIPIGFVLPIIPWYLSKRVPRVPWKYVSVPLFLHGAIQAPRHPNNTIIGGFLCAYLSQYWALRYRTKWFHNYNYILSGAIDAGSSINALLVYVLSLKGFEWWGNSPIDSEHCKPGS